MNCWTINNQHPLLQKPKRTLLGKSRINRRAMEGGNLLGVRVFMARSDAVIQVPMEHPK